MSLNREVFMKLHHVSVKFPFTFIDQFAMHASILCGLSWFLEHVPFTNDCFLLLVDYFDQVYD